MTDVAIAFDGLGFAYEPEGWVFRNYDARITTGSVVAILGPNGRGKTTLLKLLLGLLQPTVGSITVNGTTSFVPQLFSVNFNYSVLDMVVMGRARSIRVFAQPARADFTAARSALERVGIEHLADHPFEQLSGGQRQLVIFARALVANANIVILDEPTSSLDLKNQAFVLDKIRMLAGQERTTIVFSTHQPQHAAAAADHVLLMTTSDSCDFGPTAKVLSETSLSTLFGVALKRVSVHDEDRLISTFVPLL